MPFLHIFQEKLRELPLHVRISEVQQKYVQHVICDAYDKRITTIKQDNHMFYLPKLEHPVW
jgi:hypothetical protein